jgi:hypothetical protein
MYFSTKNYLKNNRNQTHSCTVNLAGGLRLKQVNLPS